MAWDVPEPFGSRHPGTLGLCLWLCWPREFFGVSDQNWRMEHGMLSCKLEETVFISKQHLSISHTWLGKRSLTFAYTSSWLMNQGLGQKRMQDHPSNSRSEVNRPWHGDSERMWEALLRWCFPQVLSRQGTPSGWSGIHILRDGITRMRKLLPEVSLSECSTTGAASTPMRYTGGTRNGSWNGRPNMQSVGKWIQTAIEGCIPVTTKISSCALLLLKYNG